MPNHFHGIIIIDSDKDRKRNGLEPFRTEPFHMEERQEDKENSLSLDIDKKEIKIHGLSEMIRSFKTFSSKRINILNGKKEYNNDKRNGLEPFPTTNEYNKFQWHKSFYDRIIRNEKELNNIQHYIKNNPLKWQTDIENVVAIVRNVQNDSNVRNGSKPFPTSNRSQEIFPKEIENYYDKIFEEKY